MNCIKDLSVSSANKLSANSREPSEVRANSWVNDGPGFQVGIYGWRKRCLYVLIMGLLIVVIINLSLTLWVLKVMEFSSDGMGQLRIVPGGLQLNGQAVVLNTLLASTIKSRRGQPLYLESSKNFTINARNDEGRVTSRLFLNSEKLECLTRSLNITDSRGTVLFSANKQEVVVGADELRVTGAGGAVFEGTVQVPLVRAASGSGLQLESPTRSLEVKAPLGIAIESRAGDISASCLTDLRLQSVAGSVRLDSENVYFPKLKIIKSSRQSHASRYDSNFHRQNSLHNGIYQLCSCDNGRLFLAPPDGLCAVDDGITCR